MFLGQLNATRKKLIFIWQLMYLFLFLYFFFLQDIEIQVDTGFVVKAELEDLVVPLIS